MDRRYDIVTDNYQELIQVPKKLLGSNDVTFRLQKTIWD